jgi:hypothetical protein
VLEGYFLLFGLLFLSITGREGKKMKKMVLLGCLFVFIPVVLFAQEKVEAPVWNVGDKWTFTGNWSIEVVKVDQTGYILKFSERKCVFESQGYDTILFEKFTRNRINVVEGDKRKKYTMGLSRVLDFPLSMGKQWETAYTAKGMSIKGPASNDFSEIYKVSGWEDIVVQAGKFKALRLEYKRVLTGASSWPSVALEMTNQYWYSPNVKYFVKCQYDKDVMKGDKEFFNWELTSFQLNK